MGVAGAVLLITIGMLSESRFRALRRRRREAFVRDYEFPDALSAKLFEQLPMLTAETAERVLDGLREWFIVCLREPNNLVGMPSRAVDIAWHEFILITRAYTDFCKRAFGRYLHHYPEAVMEVPIEAALDRTTKVLRSVLPGAASQSILLTIDRELGMESDKNGDGSLARLAPARSGSVAGGGCGGDSGGGGHGCGGGH